MQISERQHSSQGVFPESSEIVSSRRRSDSASSAPIKSDDAPRRRTSEFFDCLDRRLPAERTAVANASAADLALHDLTAIIDTPAEDSEGTTIPAPDTVIRIMITAGMTVPFVAVYVDLRSDGTIEIISLDLCVFLLVGSKPFDPEQPRDTRF